MIGGFGPGFFLVLIIRQASQTASMPAMTIGIEAKPGR